VGKCVLGWEEECRCRSKSQLIYPIVFAAHLPSNRLNNVRPRRSPSAFDRLLPSTDYSIDWIGTTRSFGRLGWAQLLHRSSRHTLEMPRC
jgi:hypothetical protein